MITLTQIGKDPRIESLLDVLLKYTSFDFSKKAKVSEIGDEIDAIATGINTLGEEFGAAKASEKIAMEELKKSEEKYRTLVEQAGDVVYATDYNGVFTYINPSCEKLTGFTAEEIIGKNYIELIPPDWKKKVTEFYQEQFKKRINETVFSFPILTKSDRQKWIEQTVHQLRENGKITGHHCIVRDISERKKFEAQLIESEKKLKESNRFIDSIIENIPNMIFVKDAKELKFVRFNKAGEDLLGYSRKDLIGKNDYDFFPKEQADFFTGKDREVIKKNAIEDILEEPIDTRLKGKRWLRTKKISIRDEMGDPLYLLGISEDITEWKKIEQQLKQSEEKLLRLNDELKQNLEKLETINAELESFTSSVSHDLRAPVRAISGFSTIIKNNYSANLDEQGKKLFETIISESLRMGKLIDDLLTFSRLGKKELIKSPIDMTALAKESADEVVRLSEEKSKARITVNDLPGVQGDASLLKQVFVNLLSNAIKFSTPKTNPVIEISGKDEEAETVFSVKDNGVGFDMKYYDKLFGIFQRLHAAEDFKGTGIGLAIVKRVITRHGGRVWAEGKVNEGATFYFSLPK